MTDAQLEQHYSNMESDRVERKESLSDPDRIRRTICSFANDLAGNGEPGVLFIGVRDDGSCSNITVNDNLLLKLSQMRDDGSIQPFPQMTVQKKTLAGCEVAVVVVTPAAFPPVRYKGRVCVRVGPREAYAGPDDERRLTEKRRANDLPFDLQPVHAASLADIDTNMFSEMYLPSAVAPDILEQNERTVEDQLASLRFVTATPENTPTVLGLLVLGKNTRDFIPGAYVQFLRIDGTELTDPIKDQKELDGPLPDLLRRVDEVIRINISTATEIGERTVESRHPDYPLAALQQLTRNAILHRTYSGTNAPVKLYWFADRVEIHSPGGPFGQVNRQNFGQEGLTDYRNPHLAEAMKDLGWVQRFGVGLQIARNEASKNGNPPPEFTVEETYVLAVVKRAG